MCYNSKEKLKELITKLLEIVIHILKSTQCLILQKGSGFGSYVGLNNLPQ